MFLCQLFYLNNHSECVCGQCFISELISVYWSVPLFLSLSLPSTVDNMSVRQHNIKAASFLSGKISQLHVVITHAAFHSKAPT